MATKKPTPSPAKKPRSRGAVPLENPPLLEDRRFVGALVFLAAVAIFAVGFAVGHAVGEGGIAVGGEGVGDQRVGEGFIGIAGTDAPGGPGALILEVLPGSPADVAGFERGDLVVAADDRDVPSMAALARIVRASAPGTVIEFTVQRGDRSIVLQTKVGSRPATDFGPPEPFPPQPRPGG